MTERARAFDSIGRGHFALFRCQPRRTIMSIDRFSAESSEDRAIGQG